MTKRRRKASKKAPKGSTSRSRARKVRAAAVSPAPADAETARRHFVSGLLIRGEAAKRDRKGKLPLHATHVIKSEHPNGSAEVRRVRFKTW